MKHALAGSAGLLVALATAAQAAPDRAPDREQAVAIGRGRALAAAHCAMCHAVAERGRSLAPTAPPFRSLRPNAPLDEVVDGLTSGADTGHPMMPRLSLTRAQSRDLVAFIRSVQDSAPVRGVESSAPKD
jgi:mono/diheme cytochrome c family protein